MADYARSEQLVALRAAKHLSQEAAAFEIGVSTKTLRSWEKGSGIHWGNAKRVAEFYGVEPETLVTREEIAPTPFGPSQLDRIEQKLDQVIERIEIQSAAEILERGLVEAGEVVERERAASARTRAAKGRRAKVAKDAA